MKLKKNMFLLLVSLACLVNKNIKGAAEEAVAAREKVSKKIINLKLQELHWITNEFSLRMRYIPDMNPFVAASYVRFNSDTQGRGYVQRIPAFGYDEKTRSYYVIIPEGHKLCPYAALTLKECAEESRKKLEKNKREVPESYHDEYDPFIRKVGLQ
jgi:hypothetical protein